MNWPGLELFVDSPLTTVATFEHTVITDVRTELTMEALRAAKDANARVCARYPAGATGLTIVRPNIRLPDAALRQASSDVMAATRDRTRANARAFLGDGFWLSTVRSVLTAIELLRPYEVPRRTFGETSSAVLWIAATIRADSGWVERLKDAVVQLETGPRGEPRHHDHAPKRGRD